MYAIRSYYEKPSIRKKRDMGRDYLLEIGCEEIPAGFVGPALWYGGQQFAEVLKKGRLSFSRVDIFGTPRRLTYIVRDLEDRQKGAEETVLGPPRITSYNVCYTKLLRVSRAIDILLSPFGFGLPGRRVTVSTAGIIPAMRDLADRYPVSFAVSLNAASEEVRSRLMPVNRRYPLRDLIAAMRGIPLRSGRKVTAEYVLLSGVNDTPAEARALARLLSGARIKVNLIPVNPHDHGDFRPVITSYSIHYTKLYEGGMSVPKAAQNPRARA